MLKLWSEKKMNVGDNGVVVSAVEGDDELGQLSCPIILFHEVDHERRMSLRTVASVMSFNEVTMFQVKTFLQFMRPITSRSCSMYV